MADLNEINSALPVKHVGADQTGLETNYVGATPNGDMQVADVLFTSATQTTLSVTNVAQACRVGGANLTNRKLLMIQAQGTNLMYGFDVASQPFILPNGTSLPWAIGPGITIWVKRTTAGVVPVVVAELA